MKNGDMERILRQGFGKGSAEFREQLLKRCLTVLESGEQANVDADEYAIELELKDDMLDAVAGGCNSYPECNTTVQDERI
ncbi:MAG TPA: hypothetical protein DCP91_05530 [Eggerthellaceae bacterium]|nr:hypothetical protein [Eggerthellaceae bacterium]